MTVNGAQAQTVSDFEAVQAARDELALQDLQHRLLLATREWGAAGAACAVARQERADARAALESLESVVIGVLNPHRAGPPPEQPANPGAALYEAHQRLAAAIGAYNRAWERGQAARVHLETLQVDELGTGGRW